MWRKFFDRFLENHWTFFYCWIFFYQFHTPTLKIFDIIIYQGKSVEIFLDGFLRPERSKGDFMKATSWRRLHEGDFMNWVTSWSFRMLWVSWTGWRWVRLAAPDATQWSPPNTNSKSGLEGQLQKKWRNFFDRFLENQRTFFYCWIFFYQFHTPTLKIFDIIIYREKLVEIFLDGFLRTERSKGDFMKATSWTGWLHEVFGFCGWVERAGDGWDWPRPMQLDGLHPTQIQNLELKVNFKESDRIFLTDS